MDYDEDDGCDGMDRQTDKWTNIGGCRVALVTENNLLKGDHCWDGKIHGSNRNFYVWISFYFSIL